MEINSIAVFGFKEYKNYFRKFLIDEARIKNIKFYYIQIITTRKCVLTFYENNELKTIKTNLFKIKKDIKSPDLAIFSLGLINPLKLFIIKILLQPGRIAWDYYDDLYYQNESLKNQVYSFIWSKFSHKVLVLNSALMYRFKNAVHWDNASHIKFHQHNKDEKNSIGTIASIDKKRFDIKTYKNTVRKLKNYNFFLFGWIKNNVEFLTKEIEELSLENNFKYYGKYSNDNLQEILSKFDIALIPYKSDQSVYYINPDKYNHFSNRGIKIVSSYIPALLSKDNILFYKDEEDLITKIDEIHKIEFKSQNNVSWSERFDELISFFK